MSFVVGRNGISENINTAIIWSTQRNLEGAVGLLRQDCLTGEQALKIQLILLQASQKKSAECDLERSWLYEVLCGPSGACENGYGASGFYIVIADKVAGLRTQLAPINFISKNHVAYQTLKKNELVMRNIGVNCFCSYKELMFRFNFRNNGFQYCEFAGNVLESIGKLAEDPFNYGYELSLFESLLPYLREWGKTNHIDFDVVGFLGFHYRNEDPEGDGTKPVYFAHVDFLQSDFRCTLECLIDEWKPNLERVLGPLSDDEYLNLNITQAINLWLPFNQMSTSNTLALMDTSSMSPSDPLLPYSNLVSSQKKYVSMVLNEDPNQRWISHPSMVLGQGVIFGSFGTPHTAVNLSDNYLEPIEFRRSIEGRFVFIKLPQH